MKFLFLSFTAVKLKSPPLRAVWIEIGRHFDCFRDFGSPPLRAVWIEIVTDGLKIGKTYVTAPAGGVD